MRRYALCTFALIAFLIAGCATINPPQTPDQTVYAALGTYASITQTTADLVESGVIDNETGRAIRASLQDMRPVLDQAREVVRNGDMPVGWRLDSVRAVQERLLEIQSNLQEAAK